MGCPYTGTVYVGGMTRKALLHFAGGETVPIHDEVMDEREAHIQLYYGDDPISEPLTVKFRLNSKMEVVLQVSNSIKVDRAVLRSPEIGERSHSFDEIHLQTSDTLSLSWAITLEAPRPETRWDWIAEDSDG